jgi:NhaP-type Na+/H+ or K+/H+ antiporter
VEWHSSKHHPIDIFSILLVITLFAVPIKTHLLQPWTNETPLMRIITIATTIIVAIIG